MRQAVCFLLAVLLAGIAVQCQDRDAPTSLEPSGSLSAAVTAGEIRDMIRALFDGKNETAGLSQFKNIDRKLTAGQTDAAIALTFDEIAWLIVKHDNGHTVDPNGGSPPTKEEALAELISALCEFVGLTCEVTSEAFEEGGDAGFGICEPGAECLVITGTKHAAVKICPGCLDETVAVLITRLPDFPSEGSLAPAVTNFYPLDSAFDQYPLFYDISTSPSPVEFNPGFFAEVALCVLDDPPHEGGKPASVDVVLATEAPGEGNCDANIECLTPLETNLLDCSDLAEVALMGPWDRFAGLLVGPFSPSLLYAMPGETGASVSGFGSAFAAVDPKTTTTLDAEPNSVFAGDPVTLTATVSPNPSGDEGAMVEFFETFTEGDPVSLGTDAVNEVGVASIDVATSTDCTVSPCFGPGPHTVVAEFLGTENFEASTSNTDEVFVNTID